MPRELEEQRDAMRRRWSTSVGRDAHERVLALIRAGAGEDFLQSDVESGALRDFLSNMWDLRGFDIRGEVFDFPTGDTFESIDFSYSYFTGSTFRNAMFGGTFRYASMRSCIFERCVFSFNHFVNCKLTDVEFISCDFVQGDIFEACELENCQFRACFIVESMFDDCRFSESTSFDDLPAHPQTTNGGDGGRPDGKLPDIYHGIREGYINGRAGGQAREYYFKEMQSLTRYASRSRQAALQGWLLEVSTGYGVRPLRVVGLMVGTYSVGTLIMTTQLGWHVAVIATAGAMLTFGAHADVLDTLGAPFQVIYVFLAFSGVALSALFITVLANVFLRER